MNTKVTLKRALYNKCAEHIYTRIDSIEKRLREVEESRNNETKSSVGDKYETGRSMMQMEEEKSRGQLHEAVLVKNRLSQLIVELQNKKVIWGSLVATDKGHFFLSIGIGKVTLHGTIYYCISSESPMGQILLQKSKGDVIQFNNSSFVIEEIY